MITKKELRRCREICEARKAHIMDKMYDLYIPPENTDRETAELFQKLLDEVYRLRKRVSKLKAMNKKANATIRWFMSKFGWEYYQKWGRRGGKRS